MIAIDRAIRALTTTLLAMFAIALVGNYLRIGDPVVLVFAAIFGIGAGALMLVPRDA